MGAEAEPTATVVAETTVAVPKFPVTCHKDVAMEDLLGWSLLYEEGSTRETFKRFVEHLVDQFDGQNDEHAGGNFGLVEKLVS